MTLHPELTIPFNARIETKPPSAWSCDVNLGDDTRLAINAALRDERTLIFDATVKDNTSLGQLASRLQLQDKGRVVALQMHYDEDGLVMWLEKMYGALAKSANALASEVVEAGREVVDAHVSTGFTQLAELVRYGEEVWVAIGRFSVQDFVEDNYGRRISEELAHVVEPAQEAW